MIVGMLRPVCHTCSSAGVCPIRLSRPEGRRDIPEQELRTFLFRKREDQELTELLPREVLTMRTGALKLLNAQRDILQLVAPGEVFPVDAHLGGAASELRAKPLMPEIEVCAMPWGSFARLMAERSALHHEIFTRIAKQSLTAKNAYHWARRPLRQRALLVLGALREQYGVPYGQFTMIDLPLTKIDLASLMCTVQESAVRILSEFREDGLISSNGKRLIIVDGPRLSDLLRQVTSPELSKPAEDPSLSEDHEEG